MNKETGLLTMGEFTYGNPIRRGHGNNITIGKFCSIAEGVIMDSGFGHDTHCVSTYPFHTFGNGIRSNIVIRGDINIGHDVWLCEGCVIMSNVTIGHGAVIGMRAIVSKDVNPYEVIVGAPQKVLRKRFTDEQIEALLKISWWDWDMEKIKENAHMLVGNIDEFINKHL